MPSTFTKKPPPYLSARWTWADVRPLAGPSLAGMTPARSAHDVRICVGHEASLSLAFRCSNSTYN